MSKNVSNFLWRVLAFAVIAFAAVSCSDDEGEKVSDLDKAVAQMEGMVQLDRGMLGSMWDEGFVTKEGYVLSKGLGSAAEFKKASARSASDADETPCVSLLSADKKVLIHLFFSEDGLPSQLVIGDNALYFNFLNDEVLVGSSPHIVRPQLFSGLQRRELVGV